MNTLDELIELSQKASAPELIGKAASRWTLESSEAVLNNMDKAPDYLKNLLYIINFNNIFTSLGLKGFITHSSKKTYVKTVAAFNYVGYLPVIKVLTEIADKPELTLYYRDRNYKWPADFEQKLAFMEARVKRINYSKLLIMHLERYLDSVMHHAAAPLTCSQLFNVGFQNSKRH